jgi:dipeptidyl aminopeptidase/acylaminoacyl peptidase
LTSFEYTHTLQPLGFEVAPSWQGYPLHYDFLLLNFECSTGASLISLYTDGRDMGLTFIHSPDGYQDVYIRDDRGKKHAVSMIGVCWLGIPVPPEAQESEYILLYFKSLPPFQFDLTPPPDIPLGQICFVSERDGNAEIYAMNPDGEEQVRLTFQSSREVEPAWSPDGLRIAFVSNLSADNEIYVMAAEGIYPINLTQNPRSDGAPAWAPSGRLIAFHTERDGNLEIYLMNADGSGPYNLTNDPGADAYPAWAPDGSRIVFQSNRDGNWELYTLQVASAELSRLTHTIADEQRPAWSPGGDQIAYWSGRNGVWHLQVMNADGSGAKALVEFANPGPRPSRPAWSPDGCHIVFTILRDENQEIYLMNADGSNLRRLTENEDDDYDPCW